MIISSQYIFILLFLLVSCGDESLITSETKNNENPAEVILVPNDDPDQCPPFDVSGVEVTLHADFVGAENCDNFSLFYQAIVKECADCHTDSQRIIYNDGTIQGANLAELTRESDWLSHRLNFHTDSLVKTKLVVPGGIQQSYLTQIIRWEDPNFIQRAIVSQKYGYEGLQEDDLMPSGDYADPNNPEMIKKWIESLVNARDIPNLGDTIIPLNKSEAGNMRFRRFYQVFKNKCLSCHGEGGADGLQANFDKEELYIHYFQDKGLINFQQNQNLFYGNYSASPLYNKLINNKSSDQGSMPPVDSGHLPLTEDELNIVADWIAGLGCNTIGVGFPECLWEVPF